MAVTTEVALRTKGIEISKIDVTKTIKSILDNSHAIKAVIMSMAEEKAGLPIEYPQGEPDSWKELLWSIDGQNGDYFGYDNEVEKLAAFVKLPREEQQKILYRAVFIQTHRFLGRNPIMEVILQTE